MNCSPRVLSTLSYCLFQVHLVSILEEYKINRQQKEEEKRRNRVDFGFLSLAPAF